MSSNNNVSHTVNVQQTCTWPITTCHPLLTVIIPEQQKIPTTWLTDATRAFPGQTRPSRTACFRLLLLIAFQPTTSDVRDTASYRSNSRSSTIGYISGTRITSTNYPTLYPLNCYLVISYSFCIGLSLHVAKYKLIDNDGPPHGHWAIWQRIS